MFLFLFLLMTVIMLMFTLTLTLVRLELEVELVVAEKFAGEHTVQRGKSLDLEVHQILCHIKVGGSIRRGLVDGEQARRDESGAGGPQRLHRSLVV